MDPTRRRVAPPPSLTPAAFHGHALALAAAAAGARATIGAPTGTGAAAQDSASAAARRARPRACKHSAGEAYARLSRAAVVLKVSTGVCGDHGTFSALEKTSADAVARVAEGCAALAWTLSRRTSPLAVVRQAAAAPSCRGDCGVLHRGSHRVARRHPAAGRRWHTRRSCVNGFSGRCCRRCRWPRRWARAPHCAEEMTADSAALTSLASAPGTNLLGSLVAPLVFRWVADRLDVLRATSRRLLEIETWGKRHARHQRAVGDVASTSAVELVRDVGHAGGVLGAPRPPRPVAALRALTEGLDGVAHTMQRRWRQRSAAPRRSPPTSRV